MNELEQARDVARLIQDVIDLAERGVFSPDAFRSALARYGDKLRLIAEGSA